MILISKYITPRDYRGITLFPFVFLRDAALKNDMVLLNHERIHLKQQLELLILPFYLWYVIEFIWRFIQYKRWHAAYANISFEREAYANEKDLDYLKSRPKLSFLKYL